MKMPVADDIPDEIDALKAALAVAWAKAADDQALIAHQKLQIETYHVFPSWAALMRTIISGVPPPQTA